MHRAEGAVCCCCSCTSPRELRCALLLPPCDGLPPLPLPWRKEQNQVSDRGAASGTKHPARSQRRTEQPPPLLGHALLLLAAVAALASVKVWCVRCSCALNSQQSRLVPARPALALAWTFGVASWQAPAGAGVAAHEPAACGSQGCVCELGGAEVAGPATTHYSIRTAKDSRCSSRMAASASCSSSSSTLSTSSCT